MVASPVEGDGFVDRFKSVIAQVIRHAVADERVGYHLSDTLEQDFTAPTVVLHESDG
jgi:hypothetical protein